MQSTILEATDALVGAVWRGDAAAAGDAYAADGMLLAPAPELVRGRAEIEAYWQAGIALGLSAIAFEREVLEQVEAGIVEAGRYALYVDDAAVGTVAERGTYIVLHKRGWTAPGGARSTSSIPMEGRSLTLMNQAKEVGSEAQDHTRRVGARRGDRARRGPADVCFRGRYEAADRVQPAPLRSGYRPRGYSRDVRRLGAVRDAGTSTSQSSVTLFGNGDDGQLEGTVTLVGGLGTITEEFSGIAGPLGTPHTAARGTFQIVGGTGAYAGIAGHGTFTTVADFADNQAVRIDDGQTD